MTKVAVIVPCYNQAPYIVEALESVRSQTFCDWVCVIVNDASTDDSDEVIRDYLAGIQDERFRYFSLPQNKGVAYARNYAIRHSESEYILPLDGDDKIDESYLEKTREALDENAGLNIIYTDAVQFGLHEFVSRLPVFTLESMCYQNPLNATALYRRSAYLATDGYRENMIWGYEDWDFWLQMIDDLETVEKISEPLFYARQKNDSRNQVLLVNGSREQLMRGQLKVNNPSFFKRFSSAPAQKTSVLLRMIRKLKMGMTLQ